MFLTSGTEPVYLKSAEPRRLAREALRTEAARRVAASSGLFYVPAVLHWEPAEGRLELERVSGFRSLRDLVEAGRSVLTASRALGESVAVIHESMALPTDAKPLPPVWRDPCGADVPLHGDLTLENVGVDPERGLVILDWAMGEDLDPALDMGDRYFDLVWFCLSLFWTVPRSSWRAESAEKTADAFLSGYAARFAQFSAAGLLAFDWDGLRRCAYERRNLLGIPEMLRVRRWRTYRHHLQDDGLDASLTPGASVSA